MINFKRLSRTDFDYLLQQIAQNILKADTNMRKSLSAKDKLIVTLRYLATGDSYKTLEYTFRISAQAIGKFIPEVCCCFVEVLKDFVKLPSTTDDWMALKVKFQMEEFFEIHYCTKKLKK
uniref:Transposase Helix-turn-helix domain-containing protein n=1 Tax=Anopheles epiroticus TaxID=199890 RepID=A0A182PWJ7_9DIPT